MEVNGIVIFFTLVITWINGITIGLYHNKVWNWAEKEA